MSFCNDGGKEMIIRRFVIAFFMIFTAVLIANSGSEAASDMPSAVFLNDSPGNLAVTRPGPIEVPTFILGGQWASNPFELYVLTGQSAGRYLDSRGRWTEYNGLEHVTPVLSSATPGYESLLLPAFINFSWTAFNDTSDKTQFPDGPMLLTICVDTVLDGALTQELEYTRCGSVTIDIQTPACILSLSNKAITQTITEGGNAQTQTITVSDSCGNTSFTASVVDVTEWLSIPPSGNETMDVSFNTTNLKAGSYTGKILVTSSGGATDYITVSLTVNPKPACKTPIASQSQVNFAGTKNAMFPIVSVSNSPATVSLRDCAGNQLSNFNIATDTASKSWLSATPVGSSISVKADGTGVSAAGTYRGTVTVTAAGYDNLAIPVTLTVTGGSGTTPTCSTTVVNFWPASLSFTGAAGSTTSTQHVTVTDGCNNPKSFSASASPSWIQVSPSSGSGSFYVTVGPMPSAIASGVITVNVGGISHTLNVSATPTGPQTCTPSVKLSKSAISQTVTKGSNASPAIVSVMSVANDCTTTNLAYSYSVNPSVTWMTITPQSPAAAGASMNIAFSTAALAAGTYTTTVTVTPTGSDPLTLPVTITVNTAAPASVTSLTSGVTLRLESLDSHTSKVYSAMHTTTSGRIAFGTATRDWKTKIDMLIMYSGSQCGTRLPDYNDYTVAKSKGIDSGHTGMVVNDMTFYWVMDSANQGVSTLNAPVGCYYIYEYNTSDIKGWYDLLYTDIP